MEYKHLFVLAYSNAERYECSFINLWLWNIICYVLSAEIQVVEYLLGWVVLDTEHEDSSFKVYYDTYDIWIHCGKDYAHLSFKGK